MSKNIIFCADGTWNNPRQDENNDHTPDPTNVFKLFLSLDGSISTDSILSGDEQEKELTTNGVRQIAKYIHGVGDARNPIIKLMGGAFGSGLISRIVRGYTFISRNYKQGDNIYIVGFSRGAYTARALAGLIASQGLLSTEITKDQELAYRRGAEAWFRYRSKSAPSLLARIISDLPAFISQDNLDEAKDLISARIKAVGVWDTVAAIGVPVFDLTGDRIDPFEFASTELNAKVEFGFHAVALDEQRDDFTPTLWQPSEKVIQMLFSGAHADVGGGYPTTDHESELSDIALVWMIEKLKDVGVVFLADYAASLHPKATGVAHKPWLHPPFNLALHKPRIFPKNVLSLDKSVNARIQAGDVIAEPNTPAEPYQPTNIP
ncbi:MAG: DUF2235 domain-containing protein [Methylococcales bacterium]